MKIERKIELDTLMQVCTKVAIIRYLIEKNFIIEKKDTESIVFMIKNEAKIREIDPYIKSLEVEYNKQEEIVDVQIIYEYDLSREVFKTYYNVLEIKDLVRKWTNRNKKLDDITVEFDGRLRFGGELYTVINLTSTKYKDFHSFYAKYESNENFLHIYFEGNIVNGLPEGYGKLIWHDGKLLYEGEFKNGKVTGFGRTYFLNGNISSEGFRIDGIPNGQFIQYYENGQVEFKGIEKDGVSFGLGESFYEDGRLYYKGEFAEDGWAIDGLIHYLSEDIGYKFNDKGIYIVNTDGNIKRKLNDRQFKALEERYKEKKNVKCNRVA